MGKTRAKQYSLLKDASPDCALGDKVMCVQMHGDAAFTGQGVVMEGLGLSASFVSMFELMLHHNEDGNLTRLCC